MSAPLRTDVCAIVTKGTRWVAGMFLPPGRHGFTGRNPVQSGQVDLKVKDTLTGSTRHGLTARLEYDVNQGEAAIG